MPEHAAFHQPRLAAIGSSVSVLDGQTKHHVACPYCGHPSEPLAALDGYRCPCGKTLEEIKSQATA